MPTGPLHLLRMITPSIAAAALPSMHCAKYGRDDQNTTASATHDTTVDCGRCIEFYALRQVRQRCRQIRRAALLWWSITSACGTAQDPDGPLPPDWKSCLIDDHLTSGKCLCLLLHRRSAAHNDDVCIFWHGLQCAIMIADQFTRTFRIVRVQCHACREDLPIFQHIAVPPYNDTGHNRKGIGDEWHFHNCCHLSGAYLHWLLLWGLRPAGHSLACCLHEPADEAQAAVAAAAACLLTDGSKPPCCVFQPLSGFACWTGPGPDTAADRRQQKL